jgi:hypothetical protein
MSLLGRVRSAAARAGTPSSGAGPSAGGFDHVEVPARSAEEPSRRLSRAEFDAMPLQQRVGLLVQGTLRFYRGGREVAASEAMRAAY